MPRGSSKTTKFDVWSVPVTGGKPRLVLRNASFPMDHPGGPEGLQIAFVSPRPNDSAGHSIMTGREILDSDIRQRLASRRRRLRSCARSLRRRPTAPASTRPTRSANGMRRRVRFQLAYLQDRRSPPCEPPCGSCQRVLTLARPELRSRP